MIRVYDQLMKSGRFTAAQNKADNGEYVDSVGELVAICEQKGFIPRYYVNEPNDAVDKTILDLQHYTRKLVTEEMNLGNMIETSLKQILEDKQREADLDTDDSDQVDDSIFKYSDDEEISDVDFQKYYDQLDEERKADDDFLKNLMGRN